MGGDQQIQQNPSFGPRGSLAELLFANDLELTKLLILKGGLFDSSSISEHLLTLSVLYGKATKLITWAAYDEIDSTKSEGTLFRGTSHATRLMSHFFMQPIGQEYLKQIVLPLLSNMTSCGGSFEIDPERIDSTQSADDNLARLLSVVQTFLDTIMESRKKFPPLFSEVLSLIQQKTKEKFSTAEHNVIGGFVFLRFLCPAMVTPEKYSIINVSPTKEVRRGLVLVSKILQTIANGVEFGMKEGFMVKLNPFVEKNMQMMTDYFDDITNAADRDPQKVRSDTVGVSSSKQLGSSPTLQKSMSMFLSRVRSSTQSGPGAALNAKAAETLLSIDIYLQTNRATVLQGLPEHLQQQLVQVLDGLIKKDTPERKKTAEVTSPERKKTAEVTSPERKKTAEAVPEKKKALEEPIKVNPKLSQLEPARRRSASFKGTPSFVQSLRNIGSSSSSSSGEPKRLRQQQQDDLNKYEIEHLRERLAIEVKEKDSLKKTVADTTKERDFFKQVFDAAVLEGDQIRLTLEQTMAKVHKRRDTTVIKEEAKQELKSMYDAEVNTRKAIEAENNGLREQIRTLKDSTGSLTIGSTTITYPDTAPQESAPTLSTSTADVPVPTNSKVSDDVVDKLHKQLLEAEKEIRNLQRQLAERDEEIRNLKYNGSGSDSAANSSATNSTGSENTRPTPALTLSVPDVITPTTPTTPTTPSDDISSLDNDTPRLSRHMKSKSSHMLNTITKPMLGSPTTLEPRPRTNTRNSIINATPITPTNSTTLDNTTDNTQTTPTRKSMEGSDFALKKSVSTDGLDSFANETSQEGTSVEDNKRKLENWQKEYSIKDKLKFFEMKQTTPTSTNTTTNKQPLPKTQSLSIPQLISTPTTPN